MQFFFSNRYIVFIGLISYGIYLSHACINFIVIKTAALNQFQGFNRFLIICCSAIIISIVTYYIIEIPSKKLGMNKIANKAYNIKKRIIRINMWLFDKFNLNYFCKNNKIYLDCGSNIGQGFEYFRRIYKRKFDYMLFDPNPNCYKILKDKYSHLKNVKIFNNAIYIDDTEKVFKFISDTDFGGSLIKEHNSDYDSDAYLMKTFGTTQFRELNVKCINLIDLIKELSNVYKQIYIKLDIESAEYDVLEKMISTNTIYKVKKIHCEFHTKFMDETDKAKYIPRENFIIQYCKNNNIALEIWDE